MNFAKTQKKTQIMNKNFMLEEVYIIQYMQVG